jgi:hypothetical protein
VVWGEIGWISGDRHSFMRGGLDAHVEGLALRGFQRAWRSAEASTHDGRLGTRHSVMRPGVGPNDMGAYSRASPLRGGGQSPFSATVLGASMVGVPDGHCGPAMETTLVVWRPLGVSDLHGRG